MDLPTIMLREHVHHTGLDVPPKHGGKPAIGSCMASLVFGQTLGQPDAKHSATDGRLLSQTPR